MFEFELGVKVKDQITGFTGIVISRCEYLNKCIRYGVQAQKLTDNGKVIELWLDEQDIRQTGPGLTTKKKTSPNLGTGGPRTAPPSAFHDPR